jgi:DNA (cytosine-5)-methyltransferase 1
MRRLTVEEAAALQTFPNTWKFIGGQSSRYRQIGNAVPPLLARSVAERLLKDLAAADSESETKTLLAAA